ncbi:MAG: putative FUR1-uracil phosphoribosyltransferase [Olpidium bornovanus]|uniref:FUR1-uracil phosphoribosyltransferase n=1 Tax=Olpidium bornovanus TaxID=278681 RepID=A0A8H7ZNZ0_9FUNG|nr:MAG: putative FUR1-uracil phosphoribosyltransferase [Olpidium bornovanus]
MTVADPPAATAAYKLPEQVHLLEQTNQLVALLTIIRERNTPRADFVFYSDRIIRLLVEEGSEPACCLRAAARDGREDGEVLRAGALREVARFGIFLFLVRFLTHTFFCLLGSPGLNHLPVVESHVFTPTGAVARGVDFVGKICGVAIMRAGEAMEKGLRECCRSVRIGKILIQRDEETAEAKLFYSKLPPDIARRYVLLLDPMLGEAKETVPFCRSGPKQREKLTPHAPSSAIKPFSATGGSAIKAIEALVEQDVREDNIIFLNLICAMEGVNAVLKRFPRVKIITCAIDEGIDENKCIKPGLGDFG